ncbi:MAG: 50S ribosomal protein L4 [Gammaproteobacteria bacterium]
MQASIFEDCEFNEPLVHQAVVAYLSGGRQGSVAQKSRGQVRGGGRKPWKQKKLGRARAGSIRSPIWRGGGVTFAASPKDHTLQLNKKMYRRALKTILAEKSRHGRVRELLLPEFEKPRTQSFIDWLRQSVSDWSADDRVLLLVPDLVDENLLLSARNLARVEVLSVRQVNPVSLLGASSILALYAETESGGRTSSLDMIREWLV